MYHTLDRGLNLNIGTFDLAILAIYMVGIVLFGIWVGRSTSGLDGYLLGGRNLPWWAILGSIIATETSTVTFLSIPGILYAEDGNLTFLQLTFGYVLGRLIVVAIFLPQFFQGRPFTAYEILANRFGRATSQNASLLFVVTRTLADGLRLYLTAIVLEKVLGISMEASVIAIGSATILYTFFGGMKSVVWNDCIQLMVYLLGGLIAGLLLVQRLGWETIATFARDNDKLQVIHAPLTFPEVLSEPYTLWSGILGGIFLSLATHGSDQLMVQRYLSARNQRHASLAIALSGPVVMLQFAMFLLLGIGLTCFYRVGENAREFEKPDEMFATFIVEQLPIGVVGIVLAAVFSAAMSTLSSSLNSSATSLINDLLRHPGEAETKPSDDAVRPSTTATAEAEDSGSPSDDRRWTWFSRLATLVFGLLQIIVAIGADRYFSTSQGAGVAGSVIGGVMAIAGFVTGIILGIFFLGVFTRRVNEIAALHGMLVGLFTMTFVAFGWEPVFGYAIAWPWFAIFGSTVTFLVGWLRMLLLRNT